MAKLNQVIALANGRKTQCMAAITECYHNLQKSDLFLGFTRTYTPVKEEDKEILPAESKKMQKSVREELVKIQTNMVEMLDVIASQEYANCQAKADVVVNNEVILKDVPVTYLLFLEKQLEHLRTVAKSIPVLAADVDWQVSQSDVNVFTTNPVISNRTKKEMKAFIKYPATDKHPAQVDTFTEDVVVGTWQKIDCSAAMQITKKEELLHKIESLKDAVKMAREAANSIETEKQSVGHPIVKYIFG